MYAEMKLDQATVFQVEELTLKMPISMFSVDEELLSRHWEWLFPQYVDADRNWDMVVQNWILLIDDKVVVLDPCTGNGRNFPDFPGFDMLDTPYIERFEATGIRPEDVDYVFCTHLHMDHCGWNTQLRDGRFVPTFPNARYLMVRREYERWDPRRPGYKPGGPNEGTFEASVLPVFEAGLVQLVPDTFQMSNSLTIEPAHGHTIAHSMLHMATDSKEVFFTGDCFHHPLEFIDPDIDAGTCEDWEATRMTRRRIINSCLEKDALIVPAHFPCPFGGTLFEAKGEVRFEPFPHWDKK